MAVPENKLGITSAPELAEAEEARSNDQHFMEELTDAFNFLLAATIMIGKDAKWVENKWNNIAVIDTPYWCENGESFEDSLLVKLQLVFYRITFALSI